MEEQLTRIRRDERGLGEFLGSIAGRYSHQAIVIGLTVYLLRSSDVIARLIGTYRGGEDMRQHVRPMDLGSIFPDSMITRF